MIIEKITIQKFRGFENVEFELGTQLTVIAGKNGTQKTTLLGLLSQPFSISLKDNIMKDEMPLCGGNYKSDFKEKFKLSDKFDNPKEHEWTLHFYENAKTFTIESIKRGNGLGIRFWQKGTREKGSGYIQLPVIYLSLKRLLPMGEIDKLAESNLVQLTNEEQVLFNKWHSDILISLDKITTTNYIEGINKNTIGISTSEYDWKQNSAGQDNVGKIILAILSFKRLKEKYKEKYNGGILVIDEIDASLYTGSQLKLIDTLSKFSSKYKIQIIFTTHSLSILEYTCKKQEDNSLISERKNQTKVIYLEKRNQKIKVVPDILYTSIKNRLNVDVSLNKINIQRIDAFTEDKEGTIFSKAILKGLANKLHFIDCSLGCSQMVSLAYAKVPSFTFPNSIIILDGDVKNDSTIIRKINKLNNCIILPTMFNPETLLANFLYGLDDESPIWTDVNQDFNKEYCFRDYKIHEIWNDRLVAKKWFNFHLPIWGSNATKVVNPWMKENPELTEEFINNFKNIYNKYAVELGINELK